MLSWLDFTIIGIFVLFIAVEIKRGFGKAVFDFVALLVAVTALPMFSKTMSGFQFSADPASNDAAVLAVSFLILGIILVVIGKLIADTLLFSLEPFDPFIGGLFGFGSAVIVCHVLIKAVAVSVGTEGIPDIVRSSSMAFELLTFETYHQIVEMLYNFNRE